MDYLQKLIQQAKVSIITAIFISNLAVIGLSLAAHQLLSTSTFVIAGAALVLSALIAILIGFALGKHLMEPLDSLWQAVMHLTPESDSVARPDLEQIKFGKDLVSNLTGHIYQLISVANKLSEESALKARDLSQNFIAQNLPLPLMILDAQEIIKFANPAIASYIGIEVKDLIGKNVYMVLDMAFASEDTFDNWLKTVKTSSATASKSWERVRMDVRDNHPTLLFDLAAYYNRGNPDGHETMLILFDHTKMYSQDEQAISFVALSVHELRTPLTLLRGYIEVFEEELSGKLTPELQSFMEKMQAQAEQLMAFVNNILNVARVDGDQLELKLEKADWAAILTRATESLALRAKVRDISLQVNIAKDLPPVGVDQISVQEVINNLVDNAIKYSAYSKVINISSYLTNDGLVETTVQDYGRGIPTSVLPNLFTKFYRDHHNRSQVGGTGLGLYLSKAIITAHGGNLWVRSKEGEGSTFGFTLKPYDQLSQEAKDSGDGEMIRGAHGWIKNHSLYRR
ncbi:MAG TPA: ATP-binding protein [Candidatus Saccharimonadales bacterium]|nr:ATP-binding protein [Candidatus Saccharimonadales bacterium]